LTGQRLYIKLIEEFCVLPQFSSIDKDRQEAAHLPEIARTSRYRMESAMEIKRTT